MSESAPPRSLGKVVVELRYPQTGAFFDRRGSLLDNLRSGIRGEFKPAVGNDFVGFDTDTIHIRCDPGRATVTHERPESPVRAEEYAAATWKALNITGMPKDIVRLGTRFFIWWRTENEATAQRLLKEAGLTSVSPKWEELFGEPNGSVTVVANYTKDEMSARVSLDSARNFLLTEHAWFDRDKVKADLPAHVVQLDVDVHRSALRADPDHVAALVRSHWQLVTPWMEKLDSMFARVASRGNLQE